MRLLVGHAEGEELDQLGGGRRVEVAEADHHVAEPGEDPELASPEYGYGFVIDAGGKIVGHSGGFPGINSQLDIYVGEDYTLAVMSNYGGGAEPVIEKARSLILAGVPAA